jgi:hypothetical protein
VKDDYRTAHRRPHGRDMGEISFNDLRCGAQCRRQPPGVAHQHAYRLASIDQALR